MQCGYVAVETKPYAFCPVPMTMSAMTVVSAMTPDCIKLSQYFSGCAASGFCERGGIAIGDACNSGDICDAGAVCEDDVCLIPLDLGETGCTSVDNTFCIEGECQK